MRPRVFIACPITRGDLRQNIARAREAAAALMRAGLAPLNPALSCFAASDAPGASAGFTYPEWVEVSKAWVMAAAAVLRLPGESAGADEEVALAKKFACPVFATVEAVVAYFRAAGKL